MTSFNAFEKVEYKSLTYKGIVLESRYDFLNEYRAMKRVIDSLPDFANSLIESMWCDSKACAVYSVNVNSTENVEIVSDIIEEAFKILRGHNGLYINFNDVENVIIDPYWPDEEANFDKAILPQR